MSNPVIANDRAVRALMGRVSRDRGHHGYPAASRDYADPIECKCASCPVNDKRGHCGSPALAILNAEAQCETYLSFKNKPSVQPPPKCRQCGGRIHMEGSGMMKHWEHTDEKLGHQPVYP
jgi:hypothetical protein